MIGAWVENYNPQAGQLPGFENKVLSEYKYPYSLRLPLDTMAELTRCEGNHLKPKTFTAWLWPFKKKSWLTSKAGVT